MKKTYQIHNHLRILAVWNGVEYEYHVQEWRHGYFFSRWKTVYASVNPADYEWDKLRSHLLEEYEKTKLYALKRKKRKENPFK